MKSKWSVALRWLIGLLLIWAAIGKLGNLQEFFTSLLAYQLPLPVGLLKVTAVVLPWLELLCGLLLLADHRTRPALVWALILFCTFAICTGQAWARGLTITCGCLDLRLIGISPGGGLAAVVESVVFSFFRALLLAVGALLLLRRPVGSKEQGA